MSWIFAGKLKIKYGTKPVVIENKGKHEKLEFKVPSIKALSLDGKKKNKKTKIMAHKV